MDELEQLTYQYDPPGPEDDQLNVEPEIRLMRRVLFDLSDPDKPARNGEIIRLITPLIRAIALQARLAGETSGIERTILDAADLVLDGPE